MPLSRTDALRILELDATADVDAVKRAYRRLVRRHHPDAGGDPDRFHALQAAYERLVTEGPPPVTGPARPSRPRGAAWAEAPSKRFSDEPADLGSVAWDRPVPAGDGPVRLDRSLLAVLLSRPADAGPVAPVTARSRGPRSPLNRFVGVLDPDLTATWTAAPAGRDVGLRLRLRSRAGRRRADAATFPPGWVVERGSSTTTLTRSLHPSRDRRATAVRSTDALEAVLDAMDWPLETWFAVPAP